MHLLIHSSLLEFTGSNPHRTVWFQVPLRTSCCYCFLQLTKAAEVFMLIPIPYSKGDWPQPHNPLTESKNEELIQWDFNLQFRQDHEPLQWPRRMPGWQGAAAPAAHSQGGQPRRAEPPAAPRRHPSQGRGQLSWGPSQTCTTNPPLTSPGIWSKAQRHFAGLRMHVREHTRYSKRTRHQDSQSTYTAENVLPWTKGSYLTGTKLLRYHKTPRCPSDGHSVGT